MREKNAMVFFKKAAKSEETKGDALYIRSMGELNGEPICEILYRQDKWIVKESEALTPRQALQKQAALISAEIERATKAALPSTNPEEIAKKMGLSLGTYRKRLLFVKNNLLAI